MYIDISNAERKDTKTIATIGGAVIFLISKFAALNPSNTKSLIAKSIMNIFIKYKTPVKSSVPITKKVRKLHFMVKKFNIGHVMSSARPPANSIEKR